MALRFERKGRTLSGIMRGEHRQCGTHQDTTCTLCQLGPLLGISGEQESTLVLPGVKPALGQRFMEQISQGKDPKTKWTRDDAIAAFHNIFHIAK